MKKTTTRKSKEKGFYDDYFSGSVNSRKSQEIFYPECIKDLEQEYLFQFFGNMNNKRVLIYGIGTQASLIEKFIKRGAEVVAIDISSESVKKIKSMIAGSNYIDKCTVMEMDCENLDFEQDSFDFVFGRAIIHHLSITESIEQFRFVLKKGGKIGFIEPMGTNLLIVLYRMLTPSARTPYEHPLKKADLYLFTKNFTLVNFKFIYVLTLLAYPLRMLFTSNDKIFLSTFKFLYKIDEFLLKFPGYRLLCWNVIISGKK